MISAFSLKSGLPAPQQTLACARFEVYTPSVPDENPMTVVEDQPNQLMAQGVNPDVKRLFEIAGAKSARAAIHRVIGPRRLVQRCLNHEIRNVVERAAGGAEGAGEGSTTNLVPVVDGEAFLKSFPRTPAAVGRSCSSHVQCKIAAINALTVSVPTNTCLGPRKRW
jgi:hypothetical protein